jgi:hypothetical protein
MVMARKGEQMSLIALKEAALDLAEFDIAGMPYVPVRLFAYSGRNLYRPGERFEVSVIARDADGQPVPRSRSRRLFAAPTARRSGPRPGRPTQPSPATTGAPSNCPPMPPPARGISNCALTRRRSWPHQPAVRSRGISAGTDAARSDDSPASASPATRRGESRPAGVTSTARRRRQPPARRGDQRAQPQSAGREAARLHLRRCRRRHGQIAQRAAGNANSTTQGKAKIAVDLESVANRRSPFTVRATLSLLESGGRPVVRSIERVSWPAPVLVGLRPLFVGAYAREGASADFEVVRADCRMPS